MDNNAVIGIVVVFGMGFIGFLLNIYKQGKEQAELQYRITSEIKEMISTLNITVEKLQNIVEYLAKDIERIENKATSIDKEVDQVNMTVNTLSTIVQQHTLDINELKNKRCVGLQNIKKEN